MAVISAFALLACNNGGRPPLVGSGAEGQCPPGKSAIYDKFGGRMYVCQDEQLVLFVTCVERVSALAGVSGDTYGGLAGAPGAAAYPGPPAAVMQRARAEATSWCAHFTENRVDRPYAESRPPARAALPARHEAPSPMSDSNPYAE